MKKAWIKLKATAPYCQSRMHHVPKLEKESGEDYEARTWRMKTTTDKDGFVLIPAIAFKMSLDRAARMLGMQISGRGKATYTKHFLAGVMVLTDVPTGVHRDQVQCVTINANADGMRGSGKRVRRMIPQIDDWSGEIEVAILDDTITEEVFLRHIREAGMLVGVGQYRPENGGTNGRFTVVGTRFEVA